MGEQSPLDDAEAGREQQDDDADPQGAAQPEARAEAARPDIQFVTVIDSEMSDCSGAVTRSCSPRRAASHTRGTSIEAPANASVSGMGSQNIAPLVESMRPVVTAASSGRRASERALT